MKKILVLYHKNCLDGFGAAWAAWKKFGNRAEYIGVEPRALPKKIPKRSDVYILDNSYSPEVILELIKFKNSVTVIDHHISSEKDIKSAQVYVFDNNHSGSVLSWKFFYPKKQVPLLLRVIEDLDLWRFKILYTRAIGAYMATLEYDFRVWDKLVKDFDIPAKRKKMIEVGSLLLKQEAVYVSGLVENADLVNFFGYKVFAVNSPMLHSQIGDALWNKKPPIGIVWYEKHGRIYFSLRSNGKADVSKLARRFKNGGGHMKAAGFSLSAFEEMPWRL